MSGQSSAEEAAEQRNEGGADQRDTAAGHELLNPLGLSAGVIVAITFEQVDEAPDAKAGTDSDNEGLENSYSVVNEIHK